MLSHECESCGAEIIDPDDAELCTGDHDDYEGDVELHVDCPCPEHGFEADREPVTEPDDT